MAGLDIVADSEVQKFPGHGLRTIGLFIYEAVDQAQVKKDFLHPF
jgi:hypothetical protein